eukprot:gene16380-22330_t
MKRSLSSSGFKADNITEIINPSSKRILQNPGAANHSLKILDGNETKNKTTVFKRNFEHIDGNWPGIIYLTADNPEKLSKIASLCINDILSQLCDKNHDLHGINHQMVVESSPHLSLSKPFVLRSHQIQPFIKSLESRILSIQRLSMQICSEYHLLLNDAKNRLFVSLRIEDFHSLLKKLVNSCDETLKMFDQPTYYKDPIFHISIASFPYDSVKYSSFLNDYDSQRIFKVAKTHPIKFKNIINYVNINDDMKNGEDEDDSDNEIESISYLDNIRDIIKDFNDDNNPKTSISAVHTIISDSSDTIPLEVITDDLLLSIVSFFSTIECKIGNRTYKMKLDGCNESKREFVEYFFL